MTNIDKKIEEFNKRFGSFEVFFDESKKQYIYPQSEMVSFLRQALLDIQKETANKIFDALDQITEEDQGFHISKTRVSAITGEDYDMLY